ncbi:hypothetical protein PG984_015579 [Apiospora sp. TS-2023a]
MDTSSLEPSRPGPENEHHISPASKASDDKVPHLTVPIPPYFWGEAKDPIKTQPRHRGYLQGRELVGDGALADFERLMTEALDYMKGVYQEIMAPASLAGRTTCSRQGAAKQRKRTEAGIPEIIKLFNAERWPEPLLTCNALFGAGWANLHIGAYDARTLYSNYCLDVGFYYEHGYSQVFAEFEAVIKAASVD